MLGIGLPFIVSLIVIRKSLYKNSFEKQVPFQLPFILVYFFISILNNYPGSILGTAKDLALILTLLTLIISRS